MKLICIGDSITFGYGVKYECRWPSLLRSKRGWDVLNLGVNGDSTEGMLRRFAYTGEIAGAAVHIMGGYNDIFCGGSATEALTNIEKLVFASISRGAAPVVGIPPEIGKGVFSDMLFENREAGAACAEIRELAEDLRCFCRRENVPFVDYNDGWDDSWFLDGVHPDEEGHRFICGRVESMIDRLNNIGQ